MLRFKVCMGIGYFLNSVLGEIQYRKQMYRVMLYLLLRAFFPSVFTLLDFNNVCILTYHNFIFFLSYVLYEMASNVFLCMWWRGLASKKQKVCVGHGGFQHFQHVKRRENGCLRKGNRTIVLKQQPHHFVPHVTLKIKYLTICFQNILHKSPRLSCVHLLCVHDLT